MSLSQQNNIYVTSKIPSTKLSVNYTLLMTRKRLTQVTKLSTFHNTFIQRVTDHSHFRLKIGKGNFHTGNNERERKSN